MRALPVSHNRASQRPRQDTQPEQGEWAHFNICKEQVTDNASATMPILSVSV